MSKLGDYRVKPERRKKVKRQRKLRAKHIKVAAWGSIISLLSTVKNCDRIVFTYVDHECTQMIFWRAGREVLTLSLTWVAGDMTDIIASNVYIP